MTNATLTLETNVSLFLQGGAVNVVRPSYIEGWISPPFTPLKELIQNLNANVRKVYICDPCVKVRLIRQEDLQDDKKSLLQ